MNLSFGVECDVADDSVVVSTDKLIINLTRFKIVDANIDVLGYSRFCGNFGSVAPLLCFCASHWAGVLHVDSTRGAAGTNGDWSVVGLAHDSLFWSQLGV